MNELENIEKYLKDFKFKKQTLGGVSESDALAKIQQLSDLYAEAFRNQEIRYEAILEEKDRQIKELRENSHGW